MWYNTGMKANDTNEDFDPTLPTIREFGQADTYAEMDEFVDMDEADSYVDWDEVSDADADWRDEPADLWDDEQAFGSAGFGMDETYDF